MKTQRKFNRKKKYPCKLKRRKLPRGSCFSIIKAALEQKVLTFEDIKEGLEKYTEAVEAKLNKEV